MVTAMEHWLPKHRISVGDYYRMVEVGLLAPDARVELIEGEIIYLAPIGTDHISVVDQLTRLLVVAAGQRAIVRVQSALRLDEYSEPQPDLSLLRPHDSFYRDRHAGAAEALLVVEVAMTSVRYDRSRKVPLYARLGVPEVWLFDLEAATLEIYRNPVDGTYTDVSITPTPGVLRVPGLDGVNVDLTGVLG